MRPVQLSLLPMLHGLPGQIQPKLQQELEVPEVQNQSSPPVIQEPHHQQMSEQNKYVIIVTNCNIL